MRGTKFSVIGMGKYGKAIAQILSDRGAEVIAIDNREDLIEEVEDFVALAVTMDATDGKALEAQNIHECDAVVVAIGSNFEALLLCCFQLKELGVKRIIARSNDENQKKILLRMGIEEILEPEKEIGVFVAEQLINPNIVSFLQLPDDYEVAEIKPPIDIAERSVQDIGLRNKYRLNLITIKRCFEEDKGNSIEVVQHILGVPSADTIIKQTDTLIVFGTSRDIQRFIEINS
ncbi:MAG: trk system potassium uptake protein TrkA [Flavobacteriales bacterium]|jgi:trk system potassium uptake protein TrkA|tara:strand:- start:111 stop:806 length:696 start_codon:yes stop_codon:yes gene_type:complete